MSWAAFWALFIKFRGKKWRPWRLVIIVLLEEKEKGDRQTPDPLFFMPYIPSFCVAGMMGAFLCSGEGGKEERFQISLKPAKKGLSEERKGFEGTEGEKT